ncbi:glycosyltransferase [Ferruginibacter sp. SUN002]|uniref:glycosyltransferase n=1 Tax=Ferruginibacter sp. SUN002 TaxID=2937789 RepID=UPI003D3631AF
MKKVLIISPHFPPINSPDMQRIRMSLPHYKELGWEPTVICVDEKYVEGFRDHMLSESIPKDVPVHKIKAFKAEKTRKFGLGSLSMRCFFQMRKKGNQLLKKEKFDLVFFSTTMFHVCALGRYWKKKFNVPFIIDMQDPWRNDFYLQFPKNSRPPKFAFAYKIHKFLEARTIPHVDGLMAVSAGYITTLKHRYGGINSVPSAVIPFGVSEGDFELVVNKKIEAEYIGRTIDKINVVYIGAIVPFSVELVNAFFKSFSRSVKNKSDYHFYFIGTSYAVESKHRKIDEIASTLGISDIVTEIPQRISYFSALATLMSADILLIPGSKDIDYNASKICNNILAGRPIFSVFNNRSTVKKLMDETKSGVIIGVDGNESDEELTAMIDKQMEEFQKLHLIKEVDINIEALVPYMARNKTIEQVKLFNKVIANWQQTRK